jgi:hypothetical protein
MESLNEFYRRLLEVGFIVLRQAIRTSDCEWAEAEIEFLHNIPSLLDEPNIERHRYFWFAEREQYLEWVSAPGRDVAKSRMMTFYHPILLEMEPAVLELLASGSRSEQVTPLKNA